VNGSSVLLDSAERRLKNSAATDVRDCNFAMHQDALNVTACRLAKASRFSSKHLLNVALEIGEQFARQS
jgi:hypothetical protein